ncbi:uncharacterized protein LOC117126636 [Brassica rapa]|uniref:uncharacterized protein LOC117126636 n=1 Tax=Brassica campestris TaxID=3711 RepID=UPI00142D4D09|nr:uncharacterized protein LOC117126636 [Brassica rapa]
MEDLRLSASDMSVYRAKEQAMFDLRGPDDDSYMSWLSISSGQDGNFPSVSFGICNSNSEDTEAWTWFLQKVERILADSSNLAIISDRATSIANAVSCVYPQAHHGFCIVHLARNVNARFSSKGLARLVTAAATAHRMRDYKNFCDKIRASNSECGIYLGKIGSARWSRTYFGGQRYNIMTSNIAEQLNNALVEGRSSPIIELVMFIQGMMTRWFSARRKKANKHRGLMTIEVDKVMTKTMALVKGSKVNSISSWSCQVVGKFGGSESVQLEQKKCTCKYFDNMKIPCGHAMIAADNIGLAYETMVGHWYKTVAWRETYAGVIRPIGDPRDESIPEDVRDAMLMPPLTKRPPGRRRTKRFPSTGEMPGPKKKSVPNKCGRCRVEGHNRTNCTVPI